jgi:hypothetical protein
MGDERETPGKIILGELGDIESGVRQLIRNSPLEVLGSVVSPSGQVLRVPTSCTDHRTEVPQHRRVSASTPVRTTEVLEGVVARACKLAADSEQEDEGIRGPGPRHQVWAVQAEFAERIGTSRSRLSTCMSGKVVPSATLMVRMQRLADTITPPRGLVVVRKAKRVS